MSDLQLEHYLESSQYINFDDAQVRRKAGTLAEGLDQLKDIAEACFKFVRDEIRHSLDHDDAKVTIRASEVLELGTGFCYAKSHLLAALLRANRIPAALCYQRLNNGQGGFSLHGLNAVHLENHGWYRIDPRGNKQGVDSKFTPPEECLAFNLAESEENVAGYWLEPLPEVINALQAFSSVAEMRMNIPDLANFKQADSKRSIFSS